MRMIVGLGNPGLDYAGTPHNLGFAVIERLAEQGRIRGREEHHQAVLWRGRLGREEVLLVEPLTYMNRSGSAVGPLLRAEGLTPAELLVIVDDVALPWGTLRIRERGSAGGHNGLASVIEAVGTEEFLRVRLGIGAPGAAGPGLGDYVLQPMSAEEEEVAEKMVGEAAEAVRMVLREGAARAMARFNRRATAPDEGGVN